MPINIEPEFPFAAAPPLSTTSPLTPPVASAVDNCNGPLDVGPAPLDILTPPPVVAEYPPVTATLPPCPENPDPIVI